MRRGLLSSSALIVEEDLSGQKCVGQVWTLPGVEEAEDQGQLWAPGKEADDKGASVQGDLGWDQDEPLHE